MDYDIIIVGSGPSGTATALNLAQVDPHLISRTLILEKQRHPRPKLCGGGILQDGERKLKKLGLQLTNFPHVDVTEACFYFQGKGFIASYKPVSFRVVDRPHFDQMLVDMTRRLGFAIQEETTVHQIRQTENGMAVETDQGIFHSRIVVGADGANSTVRRYLNPPPGTQKARLLEIYAPPASRSQPIKQGPHQALFDFAPIIDGIQGYYWDFPMPPGDSPRRNQGIYDSRFFPDRPLGDMKALFPKWTASRGLRPDDYTLQSFPLRWFDPQGAFSAPGVILVGDAAGIDPTYGEGISFSMGYGELAAQEVQAALISKDFSFSNYRQRILTSRMGKMLQRRRAMASLLYSQKGPGMLRHIFWNFKGITNWMIHQFLIGWG